MGASPVRFFQEDLKTAADELRAQNPGLVEVTAAALAEHMNTDADVMTSVFNDHPELVTKYINPPADGSAAGTPKPHRNPDIRPGQEPKARKEPAVTTKTPRVATVAKRFDELEESLLAFAKALGEFGFSGYEQVADKVKVERSEVPKLVKQLFESLGIEDVGSVKDRRGLFREAWSQYAGNSGDNAASAGGATGAARRSGSSRQALTVVSSANNGSVAPLIGLTALDPGVSILAVTPEVLKAGLEAGALLLVVPTDQPNVKRAQVVLFSSDEGASPES